MNTSNENQSVDLEAFANMAGFPVELIKKELFNGEEVPTSDVSLADLRRAMISYLDSTMMED